MDDWICGCHQSAVLVYGFTCSVPTGEMLLTSTEDAGLAADSGEARRYWRGGKGGGDSWGTGDVGGLRLGRGGGVSIRDWDPGCKTHTTISTSTSNSTHRPLAGGWFPF